MIPGQREDAFVTGQHAIESQGKRFEPALGAKPCKTMRYSATLMCSTLAADMVKTGPVSHIDLGYHRQSSRCRASFQQGQFGPGFKPD